MSWLFIFGCLIASTGNTVSASCLLEMNPPRVVVKYGESVTANCTSSYGEIAGLGWESSAGGIGLQAGVTTLPFSIDSVKQWDIEPVCYVTLRNGSQCTELLPVTVYQMPESVSIQQSPSKSGIVEGQEYNMQCDVVNVAPAGLLSVSWHKGNKIIHQETFTDSTRSPVSKISLLSLTAQRDDDGLQISCEAKLNLGPGQQNPPTMQSKPQKVTVFYAPAFANTETETVQLSAGKKITLYCNATGNPAPVYRWHLPQQEASKDEDVNQPFLTPSLQLPGNYTCRASNIRGTNVKNFKVIEASRDRTTLAAIIGAFVAVGVLLFVAGVIFVTPDGTFSLNQSKYLSGRPASSGPV